MATEEIFLNEEGVSVSNSRMMYGGQTYAMSGITSVKAFEMKPSRKGATILIIIGVLTFLTALDSSSIPAGFIGVALLIGGIAWWRMLKSDFSVVLMSASGEAKAYTSKDGDFVSKIVNAVNEAIVHRG